MMKEVFAVILMFSLEVFGQSCKEPLVAQRLLVNDVRYASPFYVVGMPRNDETVQIDNVCYSYFENGDKFFHIMSITYINGTNKFYTYTKGDISNRMGIAVGEGILDSQCVFHDYTLTPICNSTVFVLYRCFIEGSCNSNIDIGITPGVDVRVVLAANPIVSPECRTEMESNLHDTTFLAGGDYVILPQKLAPQCITRYNNTDSIGKDRAVGSKLLTDNELEERFGSFDNQAAVHTNTVTQPPPQTFKSTYQPVAPASPGVKTVPWPLYNAPSASKTSYNPYGSTVKTNGARPGYTAAQAWSTPKPAWDVTGHWNPGMNQWNHGQTVQYGTETHHHVWQSPGVQTRTTVGENPNVIYHIHSWDNSPSGCCKCN